MNTSPIVMAWTGLAGLGLLLTIRLVWDDWSYFQTIRLAVTLQRAIAWGPRWWMSLGFLGANGAFWLVWALIALVGAIVISLPPPVSELRSQAQDTTGGLLLLMEIVLAGIQVWWLVVRARTRMFARRPDEVPAPAQSAARVSRPLLHDIRNKLQLVGANIETVNAERGLSSAGRARLAEALAATEEIEPDLVKVHALIRSLAPDLNPDLVASEPGGSP